MDVAQAARLVGEALREYVMARRTADRESAHERWYVLKEAFRQTYGLSAWRQWFDCIVEEWQLGPFIFDAVVLRDE